MRSAASIPEGWAYDHSGKQAGEAVEVALAARVPDVVALALDDDGDPRSLGHDRLAREVHPEVVAGLGLQVGVVDGHRVPQL